MKKLLSVIIISICTSFAVLANDILNPPTITQDSTVNEPPQQVGENKEANAPKTTSSKPEKNIPNKAKGDEKGGKNNSNVISSSSSLMVDNNENLETAKTIVSSNTPEDIIKAKIAYWLNEISFSAQKEEKDKEYWQQISNDLSTCKNVNDIKAKIKDEYDKNKDLCDKVQELKFHYDSKAKTIDGKKISEYANEILNKFADYPSIRVLNNNKERKDESIKKFESELNKVLPSEEGRPDNSRQIAINDETNEKSSSAGMIVMWIICTLFLVIILFLIFILFRKNKALTELSENYDDLSERHIKVKNDCKVLTDKLNDEKRNREKITAEFQDYKEQITLDANRESKASVYSPPQVNVTNEIYVGLPQNGEFSGTYTSYKTGKTLYKITTQGDYGTFEFIVNNETLSFARQSKTVFLEPACDVENDISSFSNITTIRKGTVQFNNNAWKIVNKATVRLS